MASTAHAILSPSASHRWLNCTAAPALEQELPDRSSVYAEEGSLAHAICEAKLHELLDGISAEKHYQSENGGKAWTEHPLYQSEMEETSDYYRDVVAEKFAKARRHTPDAELLIETVLDFNEWIPKGFGTADAVIISDGEIDVIDYKHGKGVPVYADRNPQMMTYALGACRAFDFAYELQTVTMTIVQPRINNTSSWEIPYNALLEWGANVLTPKAKEAFNGTLGCPTTTKVGEWCRFCKAKACCRARAEAAVDLLEYQNPKMLSPHEVGELLPRASALKDWLNDLEGYALELMMEGKQVTGYKVVEGRSIRKIIRPDELVSRITEAGISKDLLFKPQELMSLGDLEKIVGKRAFVDMSEGCIEKPQGKPTIAKDSDKRPPFSTLQSDFSHIINS